MIGPRLRLGGNRKENGAVCVAVIADDEEGVVKIMGGESKWGEVVRCEINE